jgi:hypothetical protein
MLVPHVARHPARYLGTRIAETGEPLELGRLTEPGDCTLWLDEGGIHFDKPGSGAQLLPRRCLKKAELRRLGLRRVVDVTWTGARGELWISRFTAAPGTDWPSAVEKLIAAY